MVSRDALIKRINRRTRRGGERVKVTRGKRRCGDLGGFHIVRRRDKKLVARNVHLEELGRYLGALKIWECVEW